MKQFSVCVFHEKQKPIVGVYFDQKVSKFIAQITHEKKNYYGYFSNEFEAAQALNVELDIPLKNPEVGLPENKPEVSFISNRK